MAQPPPDISGSRYAPLRLEILDAQRVQTPSGSGTPAATPAHTSARPSVHPSPAPGPSTRPRLQVWEHATTYKFNGQQYSLDKMICLSAASHHVGPELAQWVKDVIRETTRVELSHTYNVLAQVHYNHTDKYEPLVDSMATKIKEIHKGAAQRFHEIGQDTEKIKRNMNTYLQLNEICCKEIADLRRDFDALYANMQATTQAMNLLSRQNIELRQKIHDLENRPVPAPVVYNAPAPVFAPVPGPAPGAPTAPVTPAPAAQPPTVPTARLCTADAPKYSGNDKKQTLEQWLLQLGVWMRVNQILLDEQRVATAIMQLEGGAAEYAHDYLERAAGGLPLGTWIDFVRFMQIGYRDMAPARRAQELLEAHCAKRHDSMTKFAEEFRSLAQKSGYSDVELIRRIDEQRSHRLRNIMISAELGHPGSLPTTWPAYLDHVLGIEARIRDMSSTTCTRTQGGSSSKPADSMDVDAVRKEEQERKPLNAEQRKWYDKSMCVYCGKHKPKFGTPCKNPKYKGRFEIPKRRKAEKTKTRVVDSQDTDSPDSQSTTGPTLSDQIAALQAQVAALQLQVTTARIKEVADKLDFVQTL
jgi:hypothetical protein